MDSNDDLGGKPITYTYSIDIHETGYGWKETQTKEGTIESGKSIPHVQNTLVGVEVQSRFDREAVE